MNRVRIFCMGLSAAFALAPGMTATVAAGSETSQAISPSEAAAEVRQLSVAPLDAVTYPPDRPAWIEDSVVLEGTVHRWPVVSSPSDSPRAASRDLREQARAAVAAYIRRTYGEEADWLADASQLSNAQIDAQLVDADRRYQGHLELGGERAYEQAVELVFTPSFRATLQQKMEERVLARRLRQLAVLGAMGLVGLATISGFCRLVAGRAAR